MTLKNKIKFSSLIIFVILTIIILEFKINTDLSYHYGKDDGFFIRFKSICILSTIFYVLMTKEKTLALMLLGFLIGLTSAIISYLICLLIIHFRYFGYVFDLLSSIIYIGSFFLIEKKINFRHHR